MAEINIEGGMQRALKAFGIVMIGLAVMVTSADFAEARKAGGFSSFGSRGSKTFSAPAATNTAPRTAAPIQRSMTPNTAQPGGIGQSAPKRGLFGGMAGGLMGGLLMGGLFGMLLGGGFGGAAGMFGMLFQILLIGGAIMLAMRFFGRNRTAQAYNGPGSDNRMSQPGAAPQPSTGQSSGGQGFGGFAIPKIGGSAQAAPATGSDEIGITPKDLETFDELLREMQQAYAAEDYSALRRITTPEAMSYLAEELGENATKGVKNDVRDVRLLQGDLAESWREGNVDYATVAMRYEAIDVMRDRTSGKVIEGDPEHPQESVEVWTFIRRPATGWSISAIQAA